jgi:hypothetical protein
MSDDDTELYDEINKKIINEQDKIFNKIIIKTQTEYQNKHYPDADPATSIKCVICGGSYTPRSRFIHNRTKKHSKKVGNIKDYVYD